MKKHIMFISLGLLNFVHGMFHIIQVIQSLLLMYSSHQHQHQHQHNSENWIDTVMHSSIFSIAMGIIGLLTLIVGIRDYIHHRKCKN